MAEPSQSSNHTDSFLTLTSQPSSHADSFVILTLCRVMTKTKGFQVVVKPLALQTDVSLKGLEKALEKRWKLKVEGKIKVKWAIFDTEEAFSTDLTRDNWAEVAEAMKERGWIDTLEFYGLEIGEGHETGEGASD